MALFTVGHSNHSIEAFIALLKQHKITAVADVRSSPYSRRFPQFNQVSLKETLKTANIAYVFLGDNLGARPKDQSCYIDGMARYDLIAATQGFANGIKRLIKGAEKYHITLMCAEQDPIVCHRAILVCPHLQDVGLNIKHIHKNGVLEPHQTLEERLLKLHNLDKLLPISESIQEQRDYTQLSLFDLNSCEDNTPQESIQQLTRQELVKKSYQLQGEKIAYVEEKSLNQEQVNERAS